MQLKLLKAYCGSLTNNTQSGSEMQIQNYTMTSTPQLVER